MNIVWDFFRPKKDQCRKSLAYNSQTEEHRHLGKFEHHRHLEKVQMVHQECKEDKIKAQDDANVLIFKFDLQAILNTPRDFCEQIYYPRKLAVYNLPVYNLGNQSGVCYL